MGRKKRTKVRGASLPPPPSPKAVAGAPPVRGAALVYGGALAYFAVCVMIYRSNGGETIGAICGDGCGGALVLGTPLEIWGAMLMAGIAATRAAFDVGTRPAVLAGLAGGLASIHAGASIALAGTQILGWAPLCWLCLIASALSVAVAVGCVPLLKRAYAFPWLPGAQALLLGAASVAAVWPSIQGLSPEQPAKPSSQQTDKANGETEALTRAAVQPDVLARLMDSLVLGDPAAPSELVVLSDFSCNVCKRFEDRTLPALMEHGVEPGLMRVRFIFTAHHGGEEMARRKLIAATCLAAAGMPAEKVIARMREANLVSVPQGIALAEDPELQNQAMQLLKELAREDEWDAVLDEHQRIDGLLRGEYFPGDSATPLFIMVPGALDEQNLPAQENVYTFRGYQKAEPFLDFAKKAK